MIELREVLASRVVSFGIGRGGEWEGAMVLLRPLGRQHAEYWWDLNVRYPDLEREVDALYRETDLFGESFQVLWAEPPVPEAAVRAMLGASSERVASPEFKAWLLAHDAHPWVEIFGASSGKP